MDGPLELNCAVLSQLPTGRPEGVIYHQKGDKMRSKATFFGQNCPFLWRQKGLFFSLKKSLFLGSKRHYFRNIYNFQS